MSDLTLLQAKIVVSNTVVEFLQENLVHIAWVLEEQSGKLRLLLPNRREVMLSRARVLPWIGPSYPEIKSKDEIVNILNKHKEERKQIQNSVSALELWEMVQGEVVSENVKFFAELLFNNPNYDVLAAFGHTLLEQKSHFKFQNPNFEVLSKENVEKKIEAEKSAKEREALVGDGANWFNYLWELHLKGQVHCQEISAMKEPDEEVYTRLKALLLMRISDFESSHDEALWKQIVKQLPDDNHLALLLATAWGLIPKHYNYWLAAADYNPDKDFAKEYANYIQQADHFVKLLQKLGTERNTGNLKEYNFKKKIEDLKPPLVNKNSILGQQLSQKLAKTNSKNIQQETEECFAENINIKIPLTNIDDLEENKEFFATFFDKPLISIDGESTTDIDDAFTISINQDGNFEVYIALACPAAIWKFNTPFDKLILQRSTSLYLPEATYHMMPSQLSTQLFSLKEQEIKPCLLCHCIVSQEGEILSISWDVMRAIVHDNLHYNSCEAVLKEKLPINPNPEQEQDIDFLTYLEQNSSKQTLENCDIIAPELFEKANKYEDVLKIAYEFAKVRLNHRINHGAVIIEKPDLNIVLKTKENNEVEVELSQQSQTPKAQLIISELMVLANNALAEFAQNHNLPLIYRSQDIALPKEFSGIWHKPQDIAKVARCLSSATTDTNPRPHVGLGLKAYSPVTSPLRRYVDLVNSAQILHYLYKGKELWTKDELNKLLLSIHIYNDKVSLVQKMRPRYWTFLYLQQEAKRQGENCGFKAVISDENDLYVTVTLSKELVQIRSKRHLFGDKVLLGQEVMVRLGKINPLRQEVSILNVEFLY